ncbi:MAG: S1C family serine protease [Planctomycetales bacterium]
MSQPIRRLALIASLVLAFVAVGGTPARAVAADDAIDHVLPRIVKIFGAGGLRGLHAYGTGFLVSPTGHIVTVWNHVLDAEEVTVVLDTGRRVQARVLSAEPQLDLAVLELVEPARDLPHFDLSQATSVSPGTRVLGFSNMFKVAVGDEPVSVLHGVVAAKTRLAARRGAFEIPYDGPVYVLDAITNNPGAGGGVVATYDGKLVGMIGREVRNAETNTWINYAVPIEELREVVRKMISGEYIAREKKPDEETNPRRYAALDFGVVMVPDVLFRTPAYVYSVEPGSHAEKAGLRPDDLVLFVNDELVHSIRTLEEELGRLEAGDMLTVIVRRDRQLVTLQMPVEAKN